MRIIAGDARGIRIESPRDLDIRPTLDRVRESLFNILAPMLEEARFLDLFAGTGANGLEALSRGAEAVTLVDNSREALTLVRENLRRTRLSGRVTVLQLELPRELARIPGAYDIIFADPPYRFPAYEALLLGLDAGVLLDPEGMVVIECQKHTQLPERAGGLTRTREKRYGDTVLAFYRRG